MKLFKREDFDSWSKGCVKLSELPRDKLSTGSKHLNSLLGGGFPIGYITHVYGPAGSGKTNICLSSAVQCAKKGKKVLFIDTEGGFNIQRFEQVCGKSDFRNKIFLKQPHDFEEQKGVVWGLHRVLNKDFGLLALDSIVSLYRLQVDGKREHILDLSRELGKELARLSVLARENELAVIICNQVYNSFNGKEEVVPVGGDALLYWSKIVLELQHDSKPSYRNVIVRKHSHIPEGKAIKFRITSSGLE